MGVNENHKKNILLFSTLQPYPFWAGSENFWFDFVSEKMVRERFRFHLRLAESPITRKKAAELAASGADTSFYKHFNVNFARRNIYRAADMIRRKPRRTLPWYDEISSRKWDLVWFNVDGLGSLTELEYATTFCRNKGIGYWIVLQHGYEDFFLTSERDIESAKRVATGAKKFIFIAHRNRVSLERAIGQTLTNAFHSVNAISPEKLDLAAAVSRDRPVRTAGKARFFNLGRFSPKDKGQYLLLEVFSDSRWRHRDWELSFIGIDGFGKEYLGKLLSYYGIEDSRIEIVPHTSDVFAEIGSRDVLLMPSLAEGTPFAMIESMACARPAVGTTIGGIPELITDSKNGWLSRTTDIMDISDAVERMWLDRHRWPEMGDAARRQIEANFNETTTHVELLELLKEDTGL